MASPTGPGSVTIASGASLSSAVNCAYDRAAGVIIPTWTAASLTFQMSCDGVNYFDVYTDDGTTDAELTIASGGVVANHAIIFTGDAALALNAAVGLKIRSGSSASPVTQAAARVLQLIMVPRA